MKTVLVLFGGLSNEYPVSLQSAAAVVDAIDASKYEVLTVGITKEGKWLLCPTDTGAMRKDTWASGEAVFPAVLSPSREDHGLLVECRAGWTRKHVDVALPVLHGRFGEDGTVQGLLELAGIPVAGCGALASAMGIDKTICHTLAKSVGIPCPQSRVLLKGDSSCEQLALWLQKEMAGVPLPWFVKPALEGSSFGITRVTEIDALAPAIENAFEYGDKIVVEEGIAGFEVGCAVFGTKAPVTGEVDAIQLQDGFFDYHEKYNLETAKILLPAPISRQASDTVKEYALRLFHLFGCSGMSRIDFFLQPDGQVVFNEINTIPGMTNHSRYPNMLGAVGISFEEMVAGLLKEALEE